MPRKKNPYRNHYFPKVERLGKSDYYVATSSYGVKLYFLGDPSWDTAEQVDRGEFEKAAGYLSRTSYTTEMSTRPRKRRWAVMHGGHQKVPTQKFVMFHQIYPKIRYFESVFSPTFVWRFDVSPAANIEWGRILFDTTTNQQDVYTQEIGLATLTGVGQSITAAVPAASAIADATNFDFERGMGDVEMMNKYQKFYVYSTTIKMHGVQEPSVTDDDHTSTANEDKQHLPGFYMYCQDLNQDDLGSATDHDFSSYATKNINLPVNAAASGKKSNLRGGWHFKKVQHYPRLNGVVNRRVNFEYTFTPINADPNEEIDAFVNNITPSVDYNTAPTIVSGTPAEWTYGEIGFVMDTYENNAGSDQLLFQFKMTVVRRMIFFDRDEIVFDQL